MDIETVLRNGEKSLGHTPVKLGSTIRGRSHLLAVTARRTIRIDGESYLSIPHAAVDHASFERHPSERPYEGEAVVLGLIGGIFGGGGLVTLMDGGMGSVAVLLMAVGVMLLVLSAYRYSIVRPYYETLVVTTDEQSLHVAAEERDSLNSLCAIISTERR